MQGIGTNFHIKNAGMNMSKKESPEGNTASAANENRADAATGNLPAPAHLNNAVSAARYRIIGNASHTGSNLPRITPRQLEELIKNAIENNVQPGTGINLAAALAEKGYSKDISNIQFTDGSPLMLKGMNLNGISFSNCTFDWNHLSETNIASCNFIECDLHNVSFMNSRMNNCRFDRCELKETMFINADMKDVKFHDCALVNSSFEDAKMARTVFSKVRMPGTHFLDASISKSAIETSDLTDTVFCGNDSAFRIDRTSMTTAKVTKPTTATLVFPESRGVSVPLVGTKITGVAQTIPVRVAMQTPTVSKENVDAEVESFLDSRNTPACLENGEMAGSSLDKEDKALSIPQQLLKTIAKMPDAYPYASKIIAKAENLAKHVNSVVLPGGEDVSPKLYGEEKDPKNTWDGDYRRSLMELGLIHQCFTKGIPLMSICRGFQMTSVYFGAKLHQHVGRGQVGVQILGEAKQSESGKGAQASGLYGDTLKGIRAAVYHHQAVPADAEIKHIGSSLTHTVTDPANDKNWNVVMAVEQNSGAPILGLQFHPEFFKDNPSVQSTSAELTNANLAQLAREYVRPGSNERGLQNPNDMIDSGILTHMSSDNDDLWKILAGAANTYRDKTAITGDELRQQKENLRKVDQRLDGPRRTPAAMGQFLVQKLKSPPAREQAVNNGIST